MLQIDHDLARASARQQTAVTVDHGLDHAAVGQRQKDHVGAGDEIGDRRRGHHPGLFNRRRARVVPDDRIAAIADPPSDAPTHVAETDHAGFW